LALPIWVPTTMPQISGAALEFHPTLGLSEDFSDNFNLTETNKISNFRTQIIPGLGILLNGAKTRGALTANLGIAQDSVNHFGDFGIFPSVTAQARHQFDPRLGLTISDTFIRTDDPSQSSQFGLRQQRETFSSNTFGLSGDWFVGPVGLQAYYLLSTFFSGSTDTITNVFGVDGGIPLGPTTTVRGGYEFTYSNTPGSSSSSSSIEGIQFGTETSNLVWASLSRQLNPLLTGGVSASYSWLSLDSARIGNLSVFATYMLTDRLSLSASLGYSRLTSNASPDFNVPTTNTRLAYRFGPATVALTFVRDLQQTFSQGQNFGVTLSQTYGGDFSYLFTPLIDGRLRVGYSQNEPTGVGNASSGTNGSTFTAGAGVGWRVRPWLSLTLDYAFNRYEFASFTSEINGTPANGGHATENRVTLRAQSVF
jgi:hypothetical protein